MLANSLPALKLAFRLIQFFIQFFIVETGEEVCHVGSIRSFELCLQLFDQRVNVVAEIRNLFLGLVRCIFHGIGMLGDVTRHRASPEWAETQRGSVERREIARDRAQRGAPNNRTNGRNRLAITPCENGDQKRLSRRTRRRLNN